MNCKFCEADLEIDFDGSLYCDDCKSRPYRHAKDSDIWFNELGVTGDVKVKNLFSEGYRVVTKEDIQKDIEDQVKARRT